MQIKQTEGHEPVRVDGLDRISEKVLDVLDAEAFAGLRSHGALGLVYAQIFSMNQQMKMEKCTEMNRKVIVFVDGMFMRRRVLEKNWFMYKAREIREYCLKHLKQDDYLVRIYYYDCQPLQAKGVSPLNGKEINFSQLQSARLRYQLFDQLKTTPNFCLRLGYMEWNGRDWSIVGSKAAPLLKKEITVDDLSDGDIRPGSETTQISVKMALDMTMLATKKTADMFILITGRTDLIPAMELVRQEGVQIGLDPMFAPISSALGAQADFLSTHVPDNSEQNTSTSKVQGKDQ